MKKPGRFLIYQPWYVRHQIAAIDDGYVVFGDNVLEKGTGPKSGQAVIRGLPNAIGIKVKWKPTMEPDAFFTDDNRRCFEYVYSGFSNVIGMLSKGWNVYYPAAGIGTGRAELKLHAPELFYNIEKFVEMIKSKYE